MIYLLDSDTLIRAKNDFYPFDSFPGFWSWLQQLNNDSIAFSIDKVKAELVDEGDQLSNWAKMRGSDFFLKTDGADTCKSLRDLAGWIYISSYTPAAQSVFFSCADFRLVGHAMAIGATIVTFEKEADNSTTKIKIPSICKVKNVRCIDLFRLVKESPVKLSL